MFNDHKHLSIIHTFIYRGLFSLSDSLTLVQHCCSIDTHRFVRKSTKVLLVSAIVIWNQRLGVRTRSIKQYGNHSCCNKAEEEALQPSLTKCLYRARLQPQRAPAEEMRGGGRYPRVFWSKQKEGLSGQAPPPHLYMLHTVTHKKIILSPVSSKRLWASINSLSLRVCMRADPCVHMHPQKA